MAMACLGPREKRIWESMTGAGVRHNRWLRGRLAAKDAVREFVRSRFNLTVAYAEIEILPGRTGQPMAAGSWTRHIPDRVSVSLSHAGQNTAALAGRPVGGLDLGLDVEPAGRIISDRVGQRAFTAEERRLLDSAPETRMPSWRLGFWCAKEAAGKSVGSGLLGHLSDITVVEADFNTGRLTLRVAENVLSRRPKAEPVIHARVFEQGGLAAAVTPASIESAR